MFLGKLLGKKKDEDEDSLFSYKVILVGIKSAHKRTLFQTFCDDELSKDHDKEPLMGVYFKRREFKTSLIKKVKLDIWDISGKENFGWAVSQYCRGAHGVILYYDSTDINTFKHIQSIVENNLKVLSNLKVPIHIIGVIWKKSDKIVVSQKEVEQLASRISAKVSCCVLGNEKNVDKVFCNLITDMDEKCKIDFIYEGNSGNSDLLPKSSLPQSHPPSSSSSSSSDEEQKDMNKNFPASLISICKNGRQKSDSEVQRNENGLFGNYYDKYGCLCYNVSVLGNPRIGKSCLCARYLEGSGSGEVNETNTLWVSSFMLPNWKILRLRMIEGTLPLSGSDPASKDHYSHSHAILLCYDITDRASFDSVKGAAAEVRVSAMRGAVVMVVGLRYDSNESCVYVSGSEGRALADSHGMHFRECSGKYNVGVRELFTKILLELQKIDSFALPICTDDANRMLPPSVSFGGNEIKSEDGQSSSSLLEQIMSEQINKDEKALGGSINVSSDYTFEILFLGDAGTGKSTLINKYIDGVFSDEHGDGYSRDKIVRLPNGECIKLQIWNPIKGGCADCAASAFRNKRAVVICFDTTDQNSFDNAKQWISYIDRYESENTFHMIVGTKSDLPPTVDPVAVRELADSLNVPIMYCSSKTGEGVDDLFKKVLMCIDRRFICADLGYDFDKRE